MLQATMSAQSRFILWSSGPCWPDELVMSWVQWTTGAAAGCPATATPPVAGRTATDKTITKANIARAMVIEEPVRTTEAVPTESPSQEKVAYSRPWQFDLGQRYRQGSDLSR